MYVSQTKKLSQILLLIVNTSFLGLLSILKFNRPSSRSSTRFKGFSLGWLVVGSSLIRKKENSRNDYSLSFVVTRCHSLSLVTPFVVIRCTTRCHLLSLVVIGCHLSSLDISLVCLFINDLNQLS